ncbi:hypothetical protein DFJ74DRAFT_772374 [Hyaloraphidium curvatum]|nr:hypothetical protein DFJ74DRAFT_772374 [Hyaloraphidium curvatum]
MATPPRAAPPPAAPAGPGPASLQRTLGDVGFPKARPPPPPFKAKWKQPEPHFASGFGSDLYCNPANGRQLDVGRRIDRGKGGTKGAKKTAGEDGKGYFDALHGKRARAAAERALSGAGLFAGLVFHVAGRLSCLAGRNHTDMSFRHLVEREGGRMSMALDGRVTHVLCERLAAGKWERLGRSRSGVEVVGGEWVFACVEEGRRVGEGPFRVMVDRAKGTIDGFFPTAKRSSPRGSPSRSKLSEKAASPGRAAREEEVLHGPILAPDSDHGPILAPCSDPELDIL